MRFFLAITLSLGTLTPVVATSQVPVTARDSTPLVISRDAVARVAFDFGDAPPATLLVRNLEIGFANNASVSMASAAATSTSTTTHPAPTPIGTTQVRFTKDVNVLSQELAQHGVTGVRLPTVTIDVLDTLGVAVMHLSLGDVLVVSDKLVLVPRDAGLDQQRLALVESITQMQADLDEAQRQLALTDALDKRKLSSSQEVARAREHVELLQTRLANQRERLTMLERQIAAQSPLHEEVLMSAGRYDLSVP